MNLRLATINNMKNIYFSRGGEWNSSGMRGGWISKGLSGSFTKHILPNLDVKDSIVVILKQDASNFTMLRRLKSNNNVVLLDVIDWLDVQKYNSSKNENQPNFFPKVFVDYYDGYIVNNQKMKEWWYHKIDKDPKKPIFVIPHHWEDRFTNLPTKNYSKSPYFYYLGYVGHKNQNCLHIDRLKSDRLLDSHRHGSNKAYYLDKPINGVQLNIRNKDSWEYCFKPATKVSVAAAMGSLIITTYDWSVQDILDESYPYLLKDASYETVTNMMSYVTETYNGPIGNSAMKMLNDVMERTSLSNSIIPLYKSIIKHF